MVEIHMLESTFFFEHRKTEMKPDLEFTISIWNLSLYTLTSKKKSGRESPQGGGVRNILRVHDIHDTFQRRQEPDEILIGLPQKLLYHHLK